MLLLCCWGEHYLVNVVLLCTDVFLKYEIPPLEKIPARGVVPIGRALPPAQVLVLDPNQRLVPPGVQGELYIGGRQVGEGYLNRPVETAAAFVELDVPGVGDTPLRFYRTASQVTPCLLQVD